MTTSEALEAIGLVCRSLLAATFFMAVLAKVKKPRAWITRFYDFTGFRWEAPGRSLPPMAVLAVEASLVIAFVWGTSLDGIYWLSIAVLSAFSVVIGIRLKKGSTVGCGCFGADGRPLDWMDVVRNGALMGAAWIVLATGQATGSLLGHQIGVLGWLLMITSASLIGFKLVLEATGLQRLGREAV